MEREVISRVLTAYGIKAQAVPFGNGHINDTYNLIGTPYLLQRINTRVFARPDRLMRNIQLVTAHLRRRAEQAGEDPQRVTLSLLPTLDGESFFQSSDGSCYRILRRIENTRCYERAQNTGQMYGAAQVLGRFGRMLEGFDAAQLYETISDFHDTPKRVAALEAAAAGDIAGRAGQNAPMLQFALARKERCGVICRALKKGEIPLRVTHNDTKLNNFLFDSQTDRCVCLVDLDTVMPGSALYDFGDALRFGASTAAEDEADLDAVHFDMEIFAAFAKGYLEQAGRALCRTELSLLAQSVLWMTYECAVRFLTDDLNGDVYFKIQYPRQNRIRALNQFALAADIERRLLQMDRIVRQLSGCDF